MGQRWLRYAARLADLPLAQLKPSLELIPQGKLHGPRGDCSIHRTS